MGKITEKRLSEHWDWLQVIWTEYLTEQGFSDDLLETWAMCQICHKFKPWAELTLEHVKERQKWPELKWNPRNYGVSCRACNKRKHEFEQAGRAIEDYRGAAFLDFLAEAIKRDWDEVNGKYYRKG